MNGEVTGVEFNFSFSPGTTEDQILGFELAGEIWSQYLSDTYQDADLNEHNLELNVHIEMAGGLLPDQIIGASFPTIEKTSYGEVYDALLKDATTQTDELAKDYLLDYLGSQYTVDILVGEDVASDNFDMLTTSANLKALGLKPGDSQELDGYIVMNSFENSEVSWDYTYLDGPAENELSFLSTAVHELAHAMGFISGLDYSGEVESNFVNDLINYSDTTLAIANFLGADENTASVTETSVMDLYRVSLASQELGVISLTEGEAASFSLDGTFSDLEFSTGLDFQASHWTEGGLGVMNPTLGLGEEWEISINDLTVLDVIGWDVDYTADFEVADLYDAVQSQVNQKLAEGEYLIDERFADIDSILYTEAYNWSRRSTSSSSSSGGFWWSTRSSRSSTSSGGFWQVGYFATLESGDGESTIEVGSSDNSSERSGSWRVFQSGNHDWGNFFRSDRSREDAYERSDSEGNNFWTNLFSITKEWKEEDYSSQDWRDGRSWK